MKNKTTENTHTMRQILLFLLSLLAPAYACAQVAKVYENGVFVNAYTDIDTVRIKVVFSAADNEDQQAVKVYKQDKLYKTYTNTPAKRYSVVFDTYVKIGDTKWATMNIGATSVADSPETAYGDYFAWGETATYYTSITTQQTGDDDTEDVITWKENATDTHIKGEKTGYDEENYWGEEWSGLEWNPQPYDGAGTITSDYDIASISMDNLWRIPTQEDYRKLCAACGCTGTSTFTPEEVTGNTISQRGIYYIEKDATIDGTHYGVSGFLFVADDTDTCCRIFFPAAGRIESDYFNYKHESGNYWTSTYYDSGDTTQAYCVTMSNDTDININDTKQRCLGFTIRPIMK